MLKFHEKVAIYFRAIVSARCNTTVLNKGILKMDIRYAEYGGLLKLFFKNFNAKSFNAFFFLRLLQTNLYFNLREYKGILVFGRFKCTRTFKLSFHHLWVINIYIIRIIFETLSNLCVAE